MITVFVPCRDSNGTPVIVKALVEASKEQQKHGEHYDLAIEVVAEEGYETPPSHYTICFDEEDIPSGMIEHYEAIAYTLD